MERSGCLMCMSWTQVNPLNRSFYSNCQHFHLFYINFLTDDRYACLPTVSLEWTELSVNGSLPPPRCGHSATMLEKRLLVYGGRGELQIAGLIVFNSFICSQHVNGDFAQLLLDDSFYIRSIWCDIANFFIHTKLILHRLNRIHVTVAPNRFKNFLLQNFIKFKIRSLVFSFVLQNFVKFNFVFLGKEDGTRSNFSKYVKVNIKRHRK